MAPGLGNLELQAVGEVARQRSLQAVVVGSALGLNADDFAPESRRRVRRNETRVSVDLRKCRWLIQRLSQRLAS